MNIPLNKKALVSLLIVLPIGTVAVGLILGLGVGDSFTILGDEEPVDITLNLEEEEIRLDESIDLTTTIQTDRPIHLETLTYNLIHTEKAQADTITKEVDKTVWEETSEEYTLQTNEIDAGLWDIELNAEYDINPHGSDIETAETKNLFNFDAEIGASDSRVQYNYRENPTGSNFLEITRYNHDYRSYWLDLQYDDQITLKHGNDYRLEYDLISDGTRLDLETEDNTYRYTYYLDHPENPETLGMELESLSDTNTYSLTFHNAEDEIVEQYNIEAEDISFTIRNHRSSNPDDNLELYRWKMYENGERLQELEKSQTITEPLSVTPTSTTEILSPTTDETVNFDEGFQVKVQTESQVDSDDITDTVFYLRNADNPVEELVTDPEIEENSETATLTYNYSATELEDFTEIETVQLETFVDWYDAGESTDTVYFEDGEIHEKQPIDENGNETNGENGDDSTTIIGGDFVQDRPNTIVGVVGGFLLLILAGVGVFLYS